MTRRHAPAFFGGIGLASTLVALLLAALPSRGLTTTSVSPTGSDTGVTVPLSRPWRSYRMTGPGGPMSAFSKRGMRISALA